MRPQQQTSQGERKKKRSLYLFLSPLLRFLQLGAAVASFAVMIRAAVNGISYASFQALQYLIAGTVIAAAWALLMLLLDCLSLGRGQMSTAKTPTVLRIIGDFLAASFALSAGSAAAGITTFNDQGGFPLPQTLCQGNTPWNSFCARSKAATAMAFVSFFFFLPSMYLAIARLVLLSEE